jgi:hypothetical protein
MQQDQIKTLIVNILTVAIVVGAVVVGYFVFTKQAAPVGGDTTSVAQIAAETASIGAEIDNTVRDLQDLKNAVESSRIVFELPEFKNLENFSVSIPSESIGRVNPFVPTAWKLKMKAVEEAASTPAPLQSPVQTAPVIGDQPQAGAPADLLGDFSVGI